LVVFIRPVPNPTLFISQVREAASETLSGLIHYGFFKVDKNLQVRIVDWVDSSCVYYVLYKNFIVNKTDSSKLYLNI
jgi:hypothetical protein